MNYTDSILFDISNTPDANLLRMYRSNELLKAGAKKVTVANGQPVDSITAAEELVLASVPLIQLPAPQKNTGLSPSDLAAWRVVAYANRGAVLIQDRTLVLANALLMNPEMAARFKNATTLPPLTVGRWERAGLLGVLEVYVSDIIPPDEFVVAVKASGTGNAAAAVVTAENGSLHLVTTIPENELALAPANAYFARYRF